MVVTAHVTCAQVLDTLRSSGLTYTINETPYSVYLTVRKKYTKDYSPSQLSYDLRNDGGDKASNDILAQLFSNHVSIRQDMIDSKFALVALGRATSAKLNDLYEHIHMLP